MGDLDLNAILAVLAGLSLRFGIPLLLTGLAAWGLRRLDLRWQHAAEHRAPGAVGVGAAPLEIRCWETMDCPPERRSNCPALAQAGTPCWQVFRQMNGFLPKNCLGCEVFLNAPARL
jgi:hypothetical protein